jgi:hypothetical protein
VLKEIDMNMLKIIAHIFRAASIAAMIAGASIAVAQPVDPQTDPFPVLDFAEAHKTVSVQLSFVDRMTVVLLGGEVVTQPTHVRISDPPLLRVEVADLGGVMLEQFNAWHPQWAFEEDDFGRERRIIRTNVSGSFNFPFDPAAAEMIVTDNALNLTVATVDLLPITHDYCRENPGDLDCTELANRPPVCNTGSGYLAECAGATTQLTLDGTASSDPDGDAIVDYLWGGEFLEMTASGPTPVVTFPGHGDYLVSLVVEDEYAATSSCETVAHVVDTGLPALACNNPPTMTPPSAPQSFTATAVDQCDGALTPAVGEVTCFRYKGTERKVHNNCHVEIAGDTLTIRNSGGVGNHVEWTIEVTDGSGNSSTATCLITVVRPGN